MGHLARAGARIACVARAAWPLWSALLVLWVFRLAGRLGFSPLDEGYVLAQGSRLLAGELPHRDFISPRPVASALLHLGDRLVPLPLFEASRLVCVVEVVAYSLAFAALVYRAPPRRWSLAQSLGAAAAALVNLHAFPLMAWYTIDGIALIAAGLVLIEGGLARERRALVTLGLLSLGLAPVTKQSFFLAPALGLVRLLAASRGQPARRRAMGLCRAAFVAAAPGAVYLGAIAAAGGREAMQLQLLATPPAWGEPLLAIFGRDRVRANPLPLLAAVGALALGIGGLERLVRRAPQRAAPYRAAGLVLCGLLSWLVVRTALGEELVGFFAPSGRALWSVRLFWILALVVLCRWLLTRAVDGTACALLATAWMTALSWGYPFASLVGGSLALCALDRTWSGLALPPVAQRWLWLPFAAAAGLAAWMTARTFMVARSFPYQDRPAHLLTAPLREVSPAFGAIRTNPTTARYLRHLVACIRRFPASRAAVLPDNAWLYPGLAVRNPLPLDWLTTLEYGRSEQQLLDAAARLDAEGDYLILFQPDSAFTILGHRPTRATAETQLLQPMTDRLLAALHAPAVGCSFFVGRYAPPRGAPAVRSSRPR